MRRTLDFEFAVYVLFLMSAVHRFGWWDAIGLTAIFMAAWDALSQRKP